MKRKNTQHQQPGYMDGLGKLPPQSVEIEEAILGACMLERDALPTVLQILSSDADFYKEAHKIVYNAMVQLYSNNDPVDIKTVIHKVRKNGELELVGGAYFITELTTKVNSAANIEYHARIVKEQSMKRGAIKIASQLMNEAYQDIADVFEILDEATTGLIQLSAGINTNMVNLRDEMLGLVEHIEEAKNNTEQNKPVGVPTGLASFDKMTGGLQKSDLIVVAARPGMGKTAFVNTLLRNMSLNHGTPVGFLSLEMSNKQTGLRELSAESGIELQRLINGKITNEEFQRVSAAAGVLMNTNIIIDDTPGLSPYEIRAKASLMKSKYKIGALFFDYIQLGDDKTAGTPEENVSRISATLKAIAKDLDIPVIALSQLSRQVENRGGDKKPMLSDLRGSGSIEQDADMVMFLYRPEYYGINQNEEGLSTKGMGQIIIAKYRNGKPDQGWFNFFGATTKWEDFSGPSTAPGTNYTGNEF